MSSDFTVELDSEFVDSDGLEPGTTANVPIVEDDKSPGELLKELSIGMTIGISRLGMTRAMRDDEKRQVAKLFEAEADDIKSSKVLFNQKHKSVKDVNAVLRRAGRFFKGITKPWPERNIRLLDKDDVDTFESKMAEMEEDLEKAKAVFAEEWKVFRDQVIEFDRVRSEGATEEELAEAYPTSPLAPRVGTLLHADEYRENAEDEYSFTWGVAPLDPPDYLREAHPAVWARENAKLAQRFDSAAAMFETELAEEFIQYLAKFREAMTPNPDGTVKKFRSGVIENIRKFANALGNVQIKSNSALESVVAKAKGMVDEIGEGKEGADKLRQSALLRDESLESVNALLEEASRVIQV